MIWKAFGKKWPRNEGPRMIPATISPMTLGCPILLNRKENIRLAKRMTMIWISNFITDVPRFSFNVKIKVAKDEVLDRSVPLDGCRDMPLFNPINMRIPKASSIMI
jgi:hypothetical protein